MASLPHDRAGGAVTSTDGGQANCAGGGHDVAPADFSGGRLLVTDVRVVLLLMNEARRRAIERLLGVSGGQSWLVTLIALGMLAQAAHEKADQLFRGPGGPYPSDFALGGAVLRQLLTGIGGPASQDTPLFGTLVALAVMGALLRPAVRGTVRGAQASSRRFRLAFNHRYGHFVRRSHHRQGSAPFVSDEEVVGFQSGSQPVRRNGTW